VDEGEKWRKGIKERGKKNYLLDCNGGYANKGELGDNKETFSINPLFETMKEKKLRVFTDSNFPVRSETHDHFTGEFHNLVGATGGQREQKGKGWLKKKGKVPGTASRWKDPIRP